MDTIPLHSTITPTSVSALRSTWKDIILWCAQGIGEPFVPNHKEKLIVLLDYNVSRSNEFALDVWQSQQNGSLSKGSATSKALFVVAIEWLRSVVFGQSISTIRSIDVRNIFKKWNYEVIYVTQSLSILRNGTARSNLYEYVKFLARCQRQSAPQANVWCS